MKIEKLNDDQTLISFDNGSEMIVSDEGGKACAYLILDNEKCASLVMQGETVELCCLENGWNAMCVRLEETPKVVTRKK